MKLKDLKDFRLNLDGDTKTDTGCSCVVNVAQGMESERLKCFLRKRFITVTQLGNRNLIEGQT